MGVPARVVVMDVLDRVVTSREAAHEAARQAYANAQAIVLNGRPARIVCQEHEDDRSLQQNRFYWGVVLKEISEQARIGGQRWASEAWHELGKRQFLGYEVVKVQVAGRKKPTVYRRLRSTTSLGVRAMSKYLEQVMAFAVTDLGVQFSETRWQDYRER